MPTPPDAEETSQQDQEGPSPPDGQHQSTQADTTPSSPGNSQQLPEGPESTQEVRPLRPKANRTGEPSVARILWYAELGYYSHLTGSNRPQRDHNDELPPSIGKLEDFELLRPLYIAGVISPLSLLSHQHVSSGSHSRVTMESLVSVRVYSFDCLIYLLIYLMVVYSSAILGARFQTGYSGA